MAGRVCLSLNGVASGVSVRFGTMWMSSTTTCRRISAWIVVELVRSIAGFSWGLLGDEKKDFVRGLQLDGWRYRWADSAASCEYCLGQIIFIGGQPGRTRCGDCLELGGGDFRIEIKVPEGCLWTTAEDEVMDGRLERWYARCPKCGELVDKEPGISYPCSRPRSTPSGMETMGVGFPSCGCGWSGSGALDVPEGCLHVTEGFLGV